MTARVHSVSISPARAGRRTAGSALLGMFSQFRTGGAGGARTHDRRIMSPLL